MIQSILVSLRYLVVMTVLTGVIYPLLVHGIGAMFFSKTANGSLIMKDEVVVGSELIAQKFESDRYFHSRPSAVEYATIPSGASNLGPTSAVLKDAVEKRRQEYGSEAPVDLLTASGSGLDPHLSTKAIETQWERVAKARNLGESERKKLLELIKEYTEKPDFGFLGTERVNVLRLNLAVDHELKE